MDLFKSSGADEINFTVIKHCFGEFCGLLNTYLIHYYKVGYFQT